MSSTKIVKPNICFVETSNFGTSSSTVSFVYNQNSNEICRTNSKSKSTGVVLTTLTDLLKSTFLPIGYPHSVRPEYLQYQMWDSIQGISSYLRSVLTTRSVLTGIGVGSSSTTPLSAALVWVMRDGMGMIGSLLCAYWYSESFEVYTKEWRLLADVLNNVGLTLDLVSSLIPQQYFFFITSVSVLSKSCCGLIAGATKAKISAHFALSGHLSDVTVKESTQETAVALCGLLLGTVLTKVIGTDDTSTWIVFLVLLCIHQFSNYLLVKVLVFDTLNPQRCYLMTQMSRSLVTNNCVRAMSFPSPHSVAEQESFYLPFYLSVYGPLLGASVGEALAPLTECSDGQGRTLYHDLLSLWEKEPFIVSVNRRGRVVVCLEQTCSLKNVVKAYFLACHIHIAMQTQSSPCSSSAERLKFLVDSSGPAACRWFDKVLQPALYRDGSDSIVGGWNVADYSSIKPGSCRYSTSDEPNKKLE